MWSFRQAPPNPHCPVTLPPTPNPTPPCGCFPRCRRHGRRASAPHVLVPGRKRARMVTAVTDRLAMPSGTHVRGGPLPPWLGRGGPALPGCGVVACQAGRTCVRGCQPAGFTMLKGHLQQSPRKPTASSYPLPVCVPVCTLCSSHGLCGIPWAEDAEAAALVLCSYGCILTLLARGALPN